MPVAVLDESVVVREISSAESSVADAFISSDEPPHGHGYNTWYWLLKQQRSIWLVAIFASGIPIDIMSFSTVAGVEEVVVKLTLTQ